MSASLGCIRHGIVATSFLKICTHVFDDMFSIPSEGTLGLLSTLSSSMSKEVRHRFVTSLSTKMRLQNWHSRSPSEFGVTDPP